MMTTWSRGMLVLRPGAAAADEGVAVRGGRALAAAVGGSGARALTRPSSAEASPCLSASDTLVRRSRRSAVLGWHAVHRRLRPSESCEPSSSAPPSAEADAADDGDLAGDRAGDGLPAEVRAVRGRLRGDGDAGDVGDGGGKVEAGSR